MSDQGVTMYILADDSFDDESCMRDSKTPLLFLTKEEAALYKKDGQIIIERAGCPPMTAIELIGLTYKLLKHKMALG